MDERLGQGRPIAVPSEKAVNAIGYTHYHPATRPFTDGEWTQICERVATLIDHLPERTDTAGGYALDDPLRVTYDSDVPLGPEVSRERIRFNGTSIPTILAQPQLPAQHAIVQPPALPTPPEPQPAGWDNHDWVAWWQRCQTSRTARAAAFLAANGVSAADDVDDLGHETFILRRTPAAQAGDAAYPYGFAFTKTARKPYDLLVAAVLIVCHAIAPDALAISSDGDPSEWEPALRLVTRVFPRDPYAYQLPPQVCDC